MPHDGAKMRGFEPLETQHLVGESIKRSARDHVDAFRDIFRACAEQCPKWVVCGCPNPRRGAPQAAGESVLGLIFEHRFSHLTALRQDQDGPRSPKSHKRTMFYNVFVPSRTLFACLRTAGHAV